MAICCWKSCKSPVSPITIWCCNNEGKLSDSSGFIPAFNWDLIVCWCIRSCSSCWIIAAKAILNSWILPSASAQSFSSDSISFFLLQSCSHSECEDSKPPIHKILRYPSTLLHLFGEPKKGLIIILCTMSITIIPNFLTQFSTIWWDDSVSFNPPKEVSDWRKAWVDPFMTWNLDFLVQNLVGIRRFCTWNEISRQLLCLLASDVLLIVGGLKPTPNFRLQASPSF